MHLPNDIECIGDVFCKREVKFSKIFKNFGCFVANKRRREEKERNKVSSDVLCESIQLFRSECCVVGDGREKILYRRNE